MKLREKVTSASANLTHVCQRSLVCDGVWECLENKKCKYAYNYGGDTFCREFTQIQSSNITLGKVH